MATQAIFGNIASAAGLGFEDLCGVVCTVARGFERINHRAVSHQRSAANRYCQVISPSLSFSEYADLSRCYFACDIVPDRKGI